MQVQKQQDGAEVAGIRYVVGFEDAFPSNLTAEEHESLIEECTKNILSGNPELNEAMGQAKAERNEYLSQMLANNERIRRCEVSIQELNAARTTHDKVISKKHDEAYEARQTILREAEAKRAEETAVERANRDAPLTREQKREQVKARIASAEELMSSYQAESVVPFNRRENTALTDKFLIGEIQGFKERIAQYRVELSKIEENTEQEQQKSSTYDDSASSSTPNEN